MSYYTANVKLYENSSGAIVASRTDVLAFNPNDTVPDATVTANSLLTSGYVTLQTGPGPAQPFSPVTIVGTPSSGHGMIFNGSNWVPDPATYATLSAIEPGPTIPLAITPYDGNLDAGHPGVAASRTPWNGYRFWMAFTPYPDASRENPSIRVSNDLVNWSLPPGCPDPIVSLAEINTAGYGYNSDTHPVYLADGSIAVYWRAGVANTKNAIFRKTSTDGATWTATTKVLEDLTQENSLLSPAVEYATDGTTLYMWVVWRSGLPINTSTGRIDRYTSTNGGTTWTTQTSCTIPAWLNPWHLDVKLVGGRWHMLVTNLDANGGSDTLHYLYSDDGLAWTAQSSQPSIPLDGFAYDQRFYRSALIPVAGDPLGWSVIVTGIARDGNSPWRMALIRDVELPTLKAQVLENNLKMDRNSAASASTPFVVADSFNRADSTTSLGSATSGQAWTVHAGTPGLLAGRAYIAASNSRVSIDSAAADVEIQADVLGTMAEVYLLFRLSDDSNWYRAGYDGTANPLGRMILQKRVAGTISTIGSIQVDRVLRIGDRLRVIAVGSSIWVYRNNDPVITATDAFNQTATRHGFQIAATGVYLDNFGVKPGIRP